MTRSEQHKDNKLFNKKTGVIILIILILISGIFIWQQSRKQAKVEKKISEQVIDFYIVDNIEQVFINGVVTPVQSKEFIKDNSLGTLGPLLVANGQVVDPGTVLYQYTDETTTAQLSDLKFQIENLQLEKDRARKQMQLELNELNAQAVPVMVQEGEELVQTTPVQNIELARESIRLKYDLSSYDVKINQLQTQYNQLAGNKVHSVIAPFKGVVTIPQEQNRDSAILTLTSNDYYVEGLVNERDVLKLRPQQPVSLKIIATDNTYQGEILSISNMPQQTNPSEGVNVGGLSNYTVKIALHDVADIREGFHVQGSIQLESIKIELPKEAVFEEEGKYYVLIDDFGVVAKRNVDITEEGAQAGFVIITQGLEPLDRVIVRSKLPLAEGDLLDIDGEMTLINASDIQELEHETVESTEGPQQPPERIYDQEETKSDQNPEQSNADKESTQHSE